MKIVPCDEEIISNVPKIMNILCNVYGTNVNEIQLFATLEDKRLGFIARVGELCTFIDYEGNCTYFRVNDNDEVTTIRKDNYTINFDPNPFLVDDNGMEYLLDIIPIEPDEDEYNGYVSYKQYNSKTDVLCDMHFQHMYRETNGIARIYSFHTQEIDSIFIDEDFDKKGNLKFGRLPKTCKYYGRVKFDSEELGYKLMAINDYGLEEVLSKGAYTLLRDNPAVRYVRISKMRLNGEFGDDWPFSKQLKSQDIDKMIKDYGFSKEIPSLLLSLHNGQEPLVTFVRELALEMKRVKSIYLEPEHNDLCMRLKLVPDEK